MSEAEKQRRLAYKKNRKTHLLIQSAVLIFLALLFVFSTVFYYRLNKDLYVEYTEASNVDYRVRLKDNEFYEKEWLSSGQAYVASLIDSVCAVFHYQINMEQDHVSYYYTYRIDAQLIIKDTKTGKNLFAPVYPVVKEQTELHDKCHSGACIKEQVTIDYDEYNDLANRFIDTYELDATKSTLVLKMYVDVRGSSEMVDSVTPTYVTTLEIPLTQKTVDIAFLASAPEAEPKSFMYKDSGARNVWLGISVTAGVLTALFGIYFVLFLFLTRNSDINYTIKINKLLKNYRSYIQVLAEEFDVSGYQVLYLSSFNEMLEIRDTVASPILMHENEDKTRSLFVIPTNTKLLYVFEVKVEDYDDIYGGEKDIYTKAALVGESAVIEEPVAEVADVTAEETIVEEPVPVVETPAEEDEKGGHPFGAKYSRSFLANLIQSEDEVKRYYSEIKNYILSFKGVRSRLSWKNDSYNRGRDKLLKLRVRGKTMTMYCALDAAAFDAARYHQKAVESATLSGMTMAVKVKSERGVNRAKELIDALMQKYGIAKDPKATEVDYVAELPYEDTEALIAKDLIREH